jgi:uncharacterized protein YndB with AHSA1/START domain
MKILVGLVGGILFVIFGIVVIGALLPKRHVVTRSATFRATPEQVFALITGPQSWCPDVRRSETISDPAGRTLLIETTGDGKTVTYELLAVTPPKSLTRRIATPNLPYTGSWTFSLEPGNGITTVRITEDGEVYNPLFRFVSRFILGHTRTIDDYFHALGQATSQKIEIKD